jgi:hypothetical protein
MMVHIAPCSPNGKHLGEKAYLDDPNKLIGKPFNFAVKIFIRKRKHRYLFLFL